PSGNAIAVWNRFDGSKTRVQAAYRPAGGSFGTPQTVSGGGQNASNPRVSMDQSGDAVAVWERSDGANLRIESALRPAGGSFGATTILSVSGQAAYEPKVAAGPNIDDNAVAVWTRSDGTKLRVQSARRRDVVGYPRPKGATPLYAALVPAFEACTSANRTHGAPLSSPSCAPPVQSSSILTSGTPDAPNNGQAANFSGFVRYTNLASDIRLQASLTDVRNNPSLSDYTGSVQVSNNVQLTDNFNSQETPEPGTVQAFKYTFDAPCTTTASTSIGSTCAV